MADDIRGIQTNPHLAGNLAPVRSEDDFELNVRGSIPASLRGALYRNGPNPQFDPAGNYHAFIGDGMIHGFFIDNGKVHYRNRYVRTPRWQAENKAGRPLFGMWGAPSDPSVANVPAGGANTNIVHHAGKLMALQEQSEPFEMDTRSLDSTGFMKTGGKFTAHPKIDAETGEMVWFGYSAGERPLTNQIDYGVTDATGRVTRRDRFEAPYASMIHDFMVTKNYVLFPVLPLTGSLERAMRGGPAYAWEPAKGAFLGVMKRNASVDTIRWFEVDPSYVFHPMNAWEEGSKIHCELMEYPEAPLFPRVDGSRTENTEAKLWRWTLDTAGSSNAVSRRQLDNLTGEFPRFDERLMGRPYRHGWYVANVGMKSPFLFDSIAHIDLATGKRSVRTFGGGDSVGEPIFVPRSASAPEGDGYILTVVHNVATNRSSLFILDAQDINGEPVAVAEVPRRVPSGFHGNWVNF
jgi:carotenoid cleavage dioxygenase